MITDHLPVEICGLEMLLLMWMVWLLSLLSSSIAEEHVKNTFSAFGTIDKIRILKDKGCAFVNFATLEAAK
jgi:RNA recognition motif-containing protein